MTSLSQKTIGGIAAAGTLAATFFFSKPKNALGLTGLLAAVGALGVVYVKQWVASEPNEWLLVIDNGKLVKSGIGLKTFTLPT